MKRLKEGEMNGKRGAKSLRLTVPLSLCPSVSLSLCLFFALLAGCSRAVPRAVTEAEKKAAVDEFFAGARSCWPSGGSKGKDAGNPRLAIESVVSDRKATLVRLVAYAPDEEASFYTPIYRMSAGRWSVNENGRVYLIDEQCRELKLNGSKASPGSSLIFWRKGRIPDGGLIRLKRGQSFETTLSFPPLPDRTRIGALVYDERVLPFAFN